MAGYQALSDNEQAARQACTELSIAFANAVDHRDYPRVLSLFTDDGVFERWDQSFLGQQGIAAMLEARPNAMQVRHCCSNIEITPQSNGEMTGMTYFMFFREDGDPAAPMPLNLPKMIGEYADRFVLTASGWRIAHRKVSVVFQ